jgi:hypothetical protein
MSTEGAMKKQLIITSVLAFGMSIAQAQTQTTSPAPMQGSSNDPRQGVQQPAQPAAAQGMATESNAQPAAQSFKGCLNGSPGSWTLTSDKGKTSSVSGTDSQLSPYKGQEVRIQGVQANDGSISVTSIDQVSTTCANQAASNAGTQSSNTNPNDTTTQSSTSTSTTQSTTTTQPPSDTTMNQSSTQAPASATTPETKGEVSGQTSVTSSTAPGATTPPVTSQTPPNGVGSGQTAQSTAQNPPASTADQNAASSTTGQSNNPNQNATTTANQNADQGIKHYSDMDQNAGNTKGNLPQTASPLPLLGLLGLGSLIAGLINRRKK